MPHAFVLDVSMLNDNDYLASDDINNVGEIIGGVNSGKNKGKDASHIYTAAYENGREYFRTNNPAGFICSSK